MEVNLLFCTDALTKQKNKQTENKVTVING